MKMLKIVGLCLAMMVMFSGISHAGTYTINTDAATDAYLQSKADAGGHADIQAYINSRFVDVLLEAKRLDEQEKTRQVLLIMSDSSLTAAEKKTQIDAILTE